MLKWFQHLHIKAQKSEMKTQINSWRSMLPGILSLQWQNPNMRGYAGQSGWWAYYSYRGSGLIPSPGHQEEVCLPGCKQWWIFPVGSGPVCSWPCATYLRVRQPGMSTGYESASSPGVWCGFCVRQGQTGRGEAGWEGVGGRKKLLGQLLWQLETLSQREILRNRVCLKDELKRVALSLRRKQKVECHLWDS